MIFEPVGRSTINYIKLILSHLGGLVALARGLQITLSMHHNAFVIAVVIKGQLAGMLRLTKTQRTRHHARVVDIFR